MRTETALPRPHRPLRRRAAAGLLGRVWRHRVSYLFVAPFLVPFVLFTLVPVAVAAALSFTYFNAVQPPSFAGWMNYQLLFSQDLVFLRDVLPNTFKFALFVGPVGYALAFLLAWFISQLPRAMRTVFALVMYAPSLTMGVAMAVVWQVMFTGDRTGFVNAFLLRWHWIEEPVQFLLDKAYLLNIMIGISVWSSMGVGFLAILAGLLNVDRTLYEAARVDGLKSRLQEIWHITIPMLKPQMLFAAVMSLAGTLKAGEIGTSLTGKNPTPDYAGQLMLNHILDYGFIRYEMGYASALSVVLLAMTLLVTKVCWNLLGTKEEE